MPIQAQAKQMTASTPGKAPRAVARLRLVMARAPRLLLVCDSAVKAAGLQSAFAAEAVEVVSVSNRQELNNICGYEYLLAVIDVAPDDLVDILKTLRASERQARLPVLVEASGVLAEARFAGVLTQYRAMPCGYHKLAALAHQYLSPVSPKLSTGRLL